MTGIPYSFSTLIAAAGFPLCPLARPADKTEKTALLWAESLARMLGMFPRMLLRMPTCSAESEKGIGEPWIEMGEIILA